LTQDGEQPEYGLLIDGVWIPTRDGRTAQASSPSSGEAIATVAMAGPADVDAAVAAARAVAPGWAAAGAFERARVLRGMADVVVERRDELVRALSADQGKPLAESADEVAELEVYLRMAAEDGVRLEGRAPASVDPGRRVVLQRVPLGVAGIIVPWNWPYTMAAELFAPALAAGNAVVWLAAPTTAACSALLASVLAEADTGLPPGALSFLNGDGPVAGDALAGHAGVDAVAFIGSVATGRSVAARAAGKAQILELGGNGPLVVLDDADLDAAAQAAAHGAFFNQGQVCMSTERIVVDERVADAFLGRLVRLAEALRSDGRDAPLGELISPQAAARVRGLVADALARGARLLTGGEAFGRIVQPTVLDGVSSDMRVYAEEIFGPVAAVIRVADADEALSVANDTAFGLAASVFGRDTARAAALLRQIDCGIGHVNGSTVYDDPAMPFGGVKASGHGRFGGRDAIAEFTERQWITIRQTRA
jgi:succinate-semialdehyde dehydrogenase/glutarate-semialdehyde dehydrogenase